MTTNATLAGASLPWLCAAIATSGVYIAIEVAERVPRDRRSLGLGVLAAANALGDLGSSVLVGVMLAAGHDPAAFAIPAGVGALGVVWMGTLARRGIVR